MPRMVTIVAPDSFLDERRRKGLDKSDEMWDGVIHLAPAAGSRHGYRQAKLIAVLARLTEPLGLIGGTEWGVFRPGRDDDYRIPDLSIAHPDHVTERGVEGHAWLVVEVRSPGDEAWHKTPFFGEVGVERYLIVDAESGTVHLLRNQDGRMIEQAPRADGGAVIGELGLDVRFEGEELLVRTSEGTIRI